MMDPYLISVAKLFQYYKTLGEKTIEQVPEQQLFWKYNAESNSICNLVNHLWGNMRSRWTDFLTSDGEKPWRNREAEFDHAQETKKNLMLRWEEGWHCLFDALAKLKTSDLEQIVYIRNQQHTVIEAIERQLAHYAAHVGQIVYVGKMIVGSQWTSLSIPKGKSDDYTKEMFSRPAGNRHFADKKRDKD